MNLTRTVNQIAMMIFKIPFAFLCIVSATIAVGQPKAIRFIPSKFYRQFSHKTAPATTIAPGDTIVTECVDAGGFDKSGTRLADRGNPLTGPFFIEGTKPGDVIAITLINVSLNRDYASTVETFVRRCLPMEDIKEVYGRNGKLARWTLDRKNRYAKPQYAYPHIDSLKIPLRPFMGCLGVAAPAKKKEPLTFFAGEYGGNMDFFKVTTGATVYLPVFHDGALLYMGDGHATQGDGEINGDALETSMDVAFVVRVIKSKSDVHFPRLEDATHVVTLGMAKSLEDALKTATHELLAWLQHDYHLSLKEATQVIGPSIEYKIPTLAGPLYEVAAMIRKDILKNIQRNVDIR